MHQNSPFSIGGLGKKLDGHTALLTALKILGYTPYHGSELFRPQNAKDHHNRCWAEGLIGRRKGGVRYGVAEFDKLLGSYDVSFAFYLWFFLFFSQLAQATTDGQSALYVEELVEAYPKAKVILTTRDADQWVRSMEACYYRILKIMDWNPLVYLDPVGARKLLARD